MFTKLQVSRLVNEVSGSFCGGFNVFENLTIDLHLRFYRIAGRPLHITSHSILIFGMQAIFVTELSWLGFVRGSSCA